MFQVTVYFTEERLAPKRHDGWNSYRIVDGFIFFTYKFSKDEVAYNLSRVSSVAIDSMD